MGFFTVIAEGASHSTTVHKLDVNLWLLPGLFGRMVTYCDIGIKFRVDAETRPDDLGLTIGIPFNTDGKAPTDLTDVLGTARTANLVFGNGAPAPAHFGGVTTYDDEDPPHDPQGGQAPNPPLTFLPFDEVRSMLKTYEDGDWSYSTYRVVPRSSLKAGKVYYLRLRFKVGNLGQVWRWQRTALRRSFAIADLRVNEFRDVPEISPKPYWEGALPLERVNFFLVVTAKLKEQRRSPEPKYVRPLETLSWERYLMRRITRRQGDPFLIYYWRKDNVSDVSPLRAFLEVERRRPTAAVYAWISAGIVVVALILLWPSFDLADTLLGHILALGWSALVGAGLVVLFTIAIRTAQFVITNWSRMSTWLEKREAKHFKIRQ